jgi:chromosome segregation ATPase
MEEQKEDELATTVNSLAEAKEDLTQEEAALAENQKFLDNMKVTCEDADKDFEERKKLRLSEIEAVEQTIEILTQDEARDAMSATYNFLQTSSSEVSVRRKQAADKLREIAKKANAPQLSILASSVEIDAFTKVKKAIDDMISMLKTQQDDEVKKSDWCKAELQENEMTNAKTEDRKADLEAKVQELGNTVQTLSGEITEANKQIAEAETQLQSASVERKAQNMDFQKTVADQMVTVDVLKKALAKLQKYYDTESFVQSRRQEPEPGTVAPVAQMEYKPNQGAAGVISMIEKLIHEAKELMAESKKSENEAQKAYEQTVRDTNGAVAALQKEVVTKTKAKAKATKEKLQGETDITDTVLELEDLNKMKVDLHTECDYILKNFDTRQEARGQEIEALQQAKQILSGASMN